MYTRLRYRSSLVKNYLIRAKLNTTFGRLVFFAFSFGALACSLLWLLVFAPSIVDAGPRRGRIGCSAFLRDSRRFRSRRTRRERVRAPTGCVARSRTRERGIRRKITTRPVAGGGKGFFGEPRRDPFSLLRVVLAIPTLGERGCGRTLGGVRILVGLLVVPSTDHREVSHLEGVGLLAATLQRTRHTVTHVEVARRNVRRQVQLPTETDQRRSDVSTVHRDRRLARTTTNGNIFRGEGSFSVRPLRCWLVLEKHRRGPWLRERSRRERTCC